MRSIVKVFKSEVGKCFRSFGESDAFRVTGDCTAPYSYPGFRH